MEKIKLRVSGNAIEVTERPAIITSGTIGLPVEFTFDSRWDTLTKLTVFRAGDVAITAAEPGVVPWEVLEKPNVWLQIGVYGVNADGTVAIPTLWANVCVIHTGVNPDGEVSIDPTTTVWQRVLERIDKLQADTAPAGYGLGETRGRYCDDCNTATEIGFYRLSGESCKNVPLVAPYLNYGVMLVERRVEFIQQTVSRLNLVIKRYSVDNGSTWSEWEWVNPPMYPGVEYRTTERFNGEPVYAQLFELGESTDGGQKMVYFNGEGVISHIVRIDGECDGGGAALPLWQANGLVFVEINVEEAYPNYVLNVFFEEEQFGWEMNVIVYYTKTQWED